MPSKGRGIPSGWKRQDDLLAFCLGAPKEPLADGFIKIGTNHKTYVLCCFHSGNVFLFNLSMAWLFQINTDWPDACFVTISRKEIFFQWPPTNRSNSELMRIGLESTLVLVTCCDDSLHGLRHRFTAFTGKVAKNHGLLSLDHGSRWCSINVACPLRKVTQKNFQRLEVPQCWSWFWLIAVAHCSHHFPSPGRYGEAHPWSGDLNMLDLRCHGAYYTSAKAYDLYT